MKESLEKIVHGAVNDVVVKERLGSRRALRTSAKMTSVTSSR